MQEWRPIPPLDSSYYSEKSYEDLPILLRASNQNLVEKIERRFRLTSHAQLNEDIANWIEIWLRKKIRSITGGDLSEFNSTNPYLQSIGGRTGYHLFQINRAVCNDLSIRSYLENLTKMSLTEQALRVNVLLFFNKKLTKLHFGTRGAKLETAVLMCKLGLDKFWFCE